MNLKAAIAAALLAAALPWTASADELNEDRVRELVIETIRENPQIVFEALALLQHREADARAASQTEVLARERDLLERDPNAPVLGNPDGDVTVVEFFDYNCPYCRRVTPEVEALVAADPNVRLVYREWPMLGEGSEFAARAALAAREQGEYEAFHRALMGLKTRAEEASVMKVAQEVGLDTDQLRKDMNAPEIDEHISTSVRLTRDLGFNGTPLFVIGDALAPGFLDFDQLENLVSEAREGESK